MNWPLIAAIGSIVTLVTAFFTVSNNIFNLGDRYQNWKQKRKKKKYKTSFKEDNPDFDFTTGFISNSAPGICTLTISIINRSKEVKYINMISYNFLVPNSDQFPRSCQILRTGQFPKRLEHGEPFHISEKFNSILMNTIYDYWKKDVKVYATCKSTVDDLLRSNSVEYDELAERLIPLNKEYEGLAKKLFNKYSGSLRDLEASLWQLQLFGRMTSHITKQLMLNNIPVLNYLKAKYGIVLKGTDWYEFYKDLEKQKVPSSEIENYLKSLL